MDYRRNSARMPTASGRSVFRPTVSWIVFLGWMTGCASVSQTPEGGSATAELDPAILEGVLSPGREAVAARLISSAEAELREGELEAARAAAREVVASYPQAHSSSRALWVMAQASLRLDEPADALGAAERYRSLLRPDDPRLPSVYLLLGRASQQTGLAREAVEHFLSIAPWADAAVRAAATDGIEAVIVQLDESSLEGVIRGVNADNPLLAPVLARYAVDRFLRSDEDEARRLARRAISLGATGLSLERAEAVLSGSLGDLAVTPILGAILPTSGSPRLRAFAELIQEGVRVALQLHGGASGNRPAVELTFLDDRGDPSAGPALLRELEASGALGIIGPLQEASLELAARGRATPVVLISPTSPTLPVDASHVYSLSSAEPGAARTLAAYAAGNGLTSAALLYPRNQDASFEAEAFREAYEARGGTVVGEFTYPPGTTFFEEQLRQIEALLPSVLVLPLPLRDIELLAPQVTFFGLDSLEVRVMGTVAWTRAETLGNVDPRHLNGVIAASVQPPEQEMAGLGRFVEAYENLHQHSLRSPTPALGYDAATLFLEAIRLGARTPGQLARSLEMIDGFPGATGLLSVSEGRIVRQHYLVCIQDGTLRTVPDGMIAVPIRVDPLPDPETDSIPEGPGRIVGFQCPEFGMVIDSVGRLGAVLGGHGR